MFEALLARSDATAFTKGWKQLANMGAARRYHGSVALNGQIYMAGGTVGATSYSTEFIRYDPVGGYTTLAPMPAGRNRVGMVEVGGKIYVFGGIATEGAVNTLYCYDPVAGTWSTLAGSNVPTARRSTVLVNHKGKIYAFGGVNAASSPIKESYSYTIANSAWAKLTDLPFNVYEGAVFSIGDYIYYCGGYGAGGATAAVYRFDPTGASGLGTWTGVASLPDNLYAMGFCTMGELGYLICGTNSVGTTNLVYSFNGTSWTTVDVIGTKPNPRSGLAAAPLDGVLYISGGFAQPGGVSAELWSATL